MQSAPVEEERMDPSSWTETYSEFTAWLEAAGFFVEELPDWDPDVEVEVTSPKPFSYRFFVRKVSDHILHVVRVTSVDLVRFKRWRRLARNLVDRDRGVNA